MHKQITLQACSGLLIGALAGCMSESTKAPTAPRADAAPAPAPAPVTAPAVPQGPNRIAFPADWATGTLYGSVDRYDIKRYVEFYASPGVVAEVRAGRPIPDGARLMTAAYLAQLDANGVPLKDANGRFMKGNLLAVNVQQKKKGWGDDIPAAIRNGDWVYQSFSPAGVPNDKANLTACYQCHQIGRAHV